MDHKIEYFGNNNLKETIDLTLIIQDDNWNHYMVYSQDDIREILKIIRSEKAVPITADQFATINTNENELIGAFNVIEPRESFDWKETEEDKKVTTDKRKIVYFDFETDPGCSSKTNTHIPIMVGMIEGETKKIFTGLKCVQDFIRYLEINYKGESLILYAHNCMYDFSFLVDYIIMYKDGILIKDGSFY